MKFHILDFFLITLKKKKKKFWKKLSGDHLSTSLESTNASVGFAWNRKINYKWELRWVGTQPPHDRWGSGGGVKTGRMPPLQPTGSLEAEPRVGGRRKWHPLKGTTEKTLQTPYLFQSYRFWKIENYSVNEEAPPSKLNLVNPIKNTNNLFKI